MDRLSITVFFEDPFWTIIFERNSHCQLTVAKHVFGAQPTDPELYAWLLGHMDRLVFSMAVEGAQPVPRPRNPKRRRREAKREMDANGVGTKAQTALQRQWEATQTARKTLRREERELAARRKWALRREKQKARHKGH